MGGKGRKKGRGRGVPSGHADEAEPAAVADAGHDEIDAEDDDASTSDSETVALTEVETIAPPPPPSAAADTTATVDAPSGGEPSGHADVAGAADAEVEVVDDAATAVSETVAQPQPPIAHPSPSAAAETATSVDVLGGVEAPPTEQGADINTSVSKLDETPKELPAKKPQAAPVCSPFPSFSLSVSGSLLFLFFALCPSRHLPPIIPSRTHTLSLHNQHRAPVHRCLHGCACACAGERGPV
jgi:hypothetical protein